MKNKKNKQKILVSISQSEHSRVAVKYAALFAKKNDFELEIMNVVETSGNRDYGVFSAGQKIKDEKLAESKKFFKKLVKEIEEEEGIKAKINIREGFILEEISQVIEEDKKISLIVISASPESSTKGKMAASLIENIYEKLFVPIIVIPDSMTELEMKKLT
jgi:nucleotide-binding universal stress UspA family protein